MLRGLRGGLGVGGNIPAASLVPPIPPVTLSVLPQLLCLAPACSNADGLARGRRGGRASPGGAVPWESRVETGQMPHGPREDWTSSGPSKSLGDGVWGGGGLCSGLAGGTTALQAGQRRLALG